MVISHSYVSLPEGNHYHDRGVPLMSPVLRPLPGRQDAFAAFLKLRPAVRPPNVEMRDVWPWRHDIFAV